MKAIASRLAGSKNVVLVASALAALLVACSSSNQPPEDQPKPRTVVDAGDHADDADEDTDYGPARPAPQGSCDIKAMAMNLTGILQGIASGAAGGLPERCTPGSDTCGAGKCCADPTSLTDASGLPIPIPAAPAAAPTAVGLCMPSN